MKYVADFQYLPEGSARPIDDGEAMPIETDDTGFALLPNVGDYVQLIQHSDDYTKFSGRVASRLFTYIRTRDDEIHCSVNIVVEETDADWGKLIKE